MLSASPMLAMCVASFRRGAPSFEPGPDRCQRKGAAAQIRVGPDRTALACPLDDFLSGSSEPRSASERSTSRSGRSPACRRHSRCGSRSVSAPPGSGAFPGADKAFHGRAYFVTTLLLLFAAVWRPGRGPAAGAFGPGLIVAVVTSGLVVELLQGMLTERREPELADWLADAVGVLAAAAVHAPPDELQIGPRRPRPTRACCC